MKYLQAETKRTVRFYIFNLSNSDRFGYALNLYYTIKDLSQRIDKVFWNVLRI